MPTIDTTAWKTSRRSYVCECTSRRCRTALLLTPAEYEQLASQGVVVSYWCAKRMGKKIIATDMLSTVAVVPL